MLRIDLIALTPQQAVLQIAGRLANGEVAFLEEEMCRWRDQAEQIILDLKGVKFIDRAGISMLKESVGTRLILRDGSRFIKTLLEAHGLEAH
jgi:anti-anti-sigma regulatory factor